MKKISPKILSLVGKKKKRKKAKMISDIIVSIAKYSESIYRIRLKKCTRILHTKIKIYEIKRPKILRHISYCYLYIITNDVLKNYPDLKILDLTANYDVTDEGIKHLDLHKLNLSENSMITNDGIKHLTNLRSLILKDGNLITNDGIKHLKLRMLSITNNRKITYEGIKDMDLKILKCSISTKNNMTEALGKMNLQKLSIDGCYNLFINDKIKFLKLHTLELIDINTITNDAIKNMKPYRLEIVNTPGITDEGIKNMYLHTAKFTFCNGITNQGIDHMKLNTLTLGFFSKDNITHLSENHKNLRTLDISHFFLLGDEIIGIGDRDIKDLKLDSLYIADNLSVTNEGIKNMNLTELTMGHSRSLENENFCPNITNDGIRHMNKMKCLYIFGNNNITNDGIKNMNLYSLQAYKNNKITPDGVKHMGLVNIDKPANRYIKYYFAEAGMR